MVTQSEQSDDCATLRVTGSDSLERMEKSFSEQLTEFDRKIKAQEDNASLLNEIHSTITLLMSKHDEREEEIREVLQKRYNAGKLRLETFQLVRNVLDRVVIESMATMPDAVDQGDDEASIGEATVVVGAPPGEEAHHRRLEVGTVLRDRFLLQQRVAGGSMGVVYKAHDRRLAEAEGFDPWVAIKVLSPKLSRNAHALRALQQEAAKGRCLSHPNIVRFIDLDRDGDIYFIVMEWLEGRSLAAILDENRNKKIDLTTSLDIVRQVGQALDYAHRCGVIHADVKPANIMLTATGQVKLFDFGIARIRQQQDQRHDFDPGVLGAVTPAYSSVQVLRGDDPTAADDVFSLGCLMYRMVAGHRAYGPRNAVEASDQGMEPQRPQGLDDQQWRALARSLAFSRDDRFATPAEFLEALEDREDPGPLAARPFHERIFVEPKQVLGTRRRPWGIVAAVGAVIVVGGLLLTQPELLQRLPTGGEPRFDRQGPAGEPAIEDLEAPPADVTEPPATVDTQEPAASADAEERTTSGDAEQVPGTTDATEPPAAGEERPAGTAGADEPATTADPREPPGAAADPADPAGGAATEGDLETVEPAGDAGARTPADAPVAGEPAEPGVALPDDTAGIPIPSDDAPVAGTAPRTDEGFETSPELEAQRALEAGLPPDSIGFPVARLQVRESDPAVQIDVYRLNPGDSELHVRYMISGGSATEGEDYFLPVATGLVFAPGQRSARLLIPLVQDSALESDETFSLELMNADGLPQAGLYPGIEVVIRDDDGY